MTNSVTDTEHDALRLIEAGFPCHQVGAETQRERDTGKAPPTHRLHVWWARRPLTPSRAAILGATLPADADVDAFLISVGIAKTVVHVPDGGQWVIVNETLLKRIEWDANGKTGALTVDPTVLRHFAKECERRSVQTNIFNAVCDRDKQWSNDPVLVKALEDNLQFCCTELVEGGRLDVTVDVANPDLAKQRLQFKSSAGLDVPLNWSDEDLYGYPRAFASCPPSTAPPLTVLDPTAGGGSIPFEAVRLGHDVISNELNPVGTVIQYATMQFPREYGPLLKDDIATWGARLISSLELLAAEYGLGQSLQVAPKLSSLLGLTSDEERFFSVEHIVDYLYCRQVVCPHCGGQAPLLNSLWLSKEDGDKWAVRLKVQNADTVDIETYRIHGKPSRSEIAALDAGTVDKGRGKCLHCSQVIDGDEIKDQSRGESSHGSMVDRLYCIVAVRFTPKLKKNGEVDRYTSGKKIGQVKSKKVRFFRGPIQEDFDAVALSEESLRKRWDHFERHDLIPTERIPPGHKTGDEGGEGKGTDKPLKLGTEQWFQMFTPRQLLGHLTLMDALRELKPKIINELGEDRGRAVITYLQFAIDKGVDYNSRQTRWIYQRGQVSGTFGRHDYSFKWTFGEMVFSGPHSGAVWGLSQILDAYSGIAGLLEDAPKHTQLTILNGSGARMEQVADASVDLVVNDPPYYNNVMYSELADYFYVWQKRSLRDLYPGLFDGYLTDKQSEAVANPHRDGSVDAAKQHYERLMREMYAECHRVTKRNGRMVLMFTHKSQSGWETLTQALIDSGWTISATYPVDSEFGKSMHIMENASAESSIFIVCRKREEAGSEPGMWRAFGGQGVQQRIVDEVQAGLGEFEALDLRPVDTMVASYGRALRVLSEKWPVLDGDEPVSPIRALNEASRVVAQYHIKNLTNGRLKVEDLTPEAAMSVTLYGIAGLQSISFDEVLNIARSLGIAIQSTPAGYDATGRSIGYGTETAGRRAGRGDDVVGYHAPLVRKGSNLRLAKPEERNDRRLSNPQHEWDVMQGTILKYRDGDIPVARAYLAEHADGEQTKIIDLLRVWTNEMDDEDLRREGEMILFGLQGS